MKTLTLSDGTTTITLLLEDTTARSGLENKVDKVTGKGLSTNDYTNTERTKLAGIAHGATANIGTVTGVKVNGTTHNPSSSGVVDLGNISNYDCKHTISSGVSGTVSVSFPENKRCSVMYGATADIALAIICNNGADNYIWVKNNGSAAIDITISSVTYNNTSLAASKIFLPADGIAVDKGCVCEIGVLCNADGAFITARGDLKASS